MPLFELLAEKIHTHFNATTFYLKEGLIEAPSIQTWQTFS